MAERRINRDRRIAVLGAGSWGTALAIQFSRAGRAVTLWGRDAARIEAMARARCNAKYLPDVAFPSGLELASDLATALGGADAVVVAVPSLSFRPTLAAIAATRVRLSGLCWASKGFEIDTGRLPHQVVAEMMPAGLPTAVLSGPTFAAEVAKERRFRRRQWKRTGRNEPPGPAC